ncbi:hypothetical protein U3516DRAFT_746610 [Neocallimastix sp. 'constans']
MVSIEGNNEKEQDHEKTDKINILIKECKTIESKLIGNGRPRNDNVKFRFKCLINLNDINTNM